GRAARGFHHAGPGRRRTDDPRDAAAQHHHRGRDAAPQVSSSSSTTAARRTPLYELHRAAGARFVEFSGWEMPVQYRGIIAEHASVRTRLGLFDVSHMGEIEVRGRDALALCQHVTTNDAARLGVGEAQYTLWCDEQGGTIDDTIL